MVKLIAPTGVLGVGFSYRSFRRALEQDVDFIGCDAGSTDWGPYHLGTGTSWSGRDQTRRDLDILLVGAREKNIPLLIGSAGFSGCDESLDWTRDILLEIAEERGLEFRLALIRTELAVDWIERKIADGRVAGLDGRPPLTVETVRAAKRTVAMMGPEPFQRALAQGADVVLAGRSSDAAIYASVPLSRGVPPANAWHLAKLVECGNAISEPVAAGACIVGSVDHEGLTVAPALDGVRCTPQRVAAHMLYENASPYLLREPPGTLDTTEATYEQVDDATVRVTGSVFRAQPYSVRLEGVTQLGYRSMCLAGLRDPAVISNVDHYTGEIRRLLERSAPRRFGVSAADYSLEFRRYGLDAVLGPLETEPRDRCYEIGLVIEVVAQTQTLAHQLVAASMPYLMHGVAVEGTRHSANAALAYSPAVIDLGPVFRWSIWHAAELDDPLEPFRFEYVDVTASARASDARAQASARG
jgi:hypothetical protein